MSEIDVLVSEISTPSTQGRVIYNTARGVQFSIESSCVDQSPRNILLSFLSRISPASSSCLRGDGELWKRLQRLEFLTSSSPQDLHCADFHDSRIKDATTSLPVVAGPGHFFRGAITEIIRPLSGLAGLSTAGRPTQTLS